jgi:hypothetical protein
MDESKRQDEKRLEILVKEYELLENSTTTSPGVRYSIISFAFATIGLVISGLLFSLSSEVSMNDGTSYLKIGMALALIMFFVPAFCISILYIWLGEEQRMIRMGQFCLSLENKINEKLGEEATLEWEHFKWEKSHWIKYPEMLVIAMFLGISLTFPLLGLSIMHSVFSKVLPHLLGNCAYLLSIVIFVAIDILLHIVVSAKIYKLVNTKFLIIEASNQSKNKSH